MPFDRPGYMFYLDGKSNGFRKTSTRYEQDPVRSLPISRQWSCHLVDLGYLLRQDFPTEIKDENILRKNLVGQISQAEKLVTNGQAL